MGNERTNFEKLKKVAHEHGAGIFGAADVTAIKDTFKLEGEGTANGLDYGISIGVPLSLKVIETIIDGPNKLYFHHYRQVNALLDQIALKMSAAIQNEGYQALPVAASLLIDWERRFGHLPHKLIAEKAGLGWRGKNNLIVNPEYGCAVRFATILTDMPLPDKKSLKNNCGACKSCVDACPAEALGESADDYKLDACLEKLKEFSKMRKIGHYICGICIKACPVRRDKIKRR